VLLGGGPSSSLLMNRCSAQPHPLLLVLRRAAHARACRLAILVTYTLHATARSLGHARVPRIFIPALIGRALVRFPGLDHAAALDPPPDDMTCKCAATLRRPGRPGAAGRAAGHHICLPPVLVTKRNVRALALSPGAASARPVGPARCRRPQRWSVAAGGGFSLDVRGAWDTVHAPRIYSRTIRST